MTVYGNPGVWRDDVAGQNRGFGVYKKNGKLTYKATGKKTGPKTGKPAGKSAPIGKPPKSPLQQQIDFINSMQSRQAKDITGYESAFADVLKGMGPQIQDAYSGAAGRIADYGHGTYEGLRGLLGQAQGEAQGQFDATTGNNLPADVAAKAGAEYNPDKAAEVGYTLGAALPAGSLEQQGAAFAGAAALGPEYAHQQGLYALHASQQQAIDDIAQIKQSAAASGAAMPKASASLSKSLGYLADVYGNPILDKKGKPIPVSTGGEITAYQAAQLGLAQERNALAVQKENRYITQGNNTLALRNRADQRAAESALRAGRKIDKEASFQSGVLVDSNGNPIRNSKGKLIPYKTHSAASKPQRLTIAQKSKFKGLALTIGQNARDGFTDKAGTEHPPISFDEALLEAAKSGIPDNIAYQQLAQVYTQGMNQGFVRKAVKNGWPIDIIIKSKSESVIARLMRKFPKATPAHIAWARKVSTGAA